MKVLIILGAVGFVVAYSLGNVTNEVVVHGEDGGISPLLTFITTVDGKSFFTDSTTTRNWTQASSYCKGMGMSLASITSAEQFTALANASVREFLNGYGYRLSGRDSQEVRQFSWNDTNTPLVAPFFTFKEYEPVDYGTCVWMNKKADNQTHLSFSACSAYWRVLCETST